MNRTSFFRGLVIGLFVSSFLWFGIVYSADLLVSSIKDLMHTELVQANHVQQNSIATSEALVTRN